MNTHLHLLEAFSNLYRIWKDEGLKQHLWWVQSEAVVGFFNAWQLSGDEKFLDWSERVWEFIKAHQADRKNGEWFSKVNADLTIPETDKINGWKGPYHNGRMCMEIMRRIGGRH